jgi:predicted enzyme related to lactoylglutathione lyase
MSATSAGFVWYELMTGDPAGADAFYCRVVGWTSKDAGMPDMPYRLMCIGETQIAGLMATPDELEARGVPPFWSGYIGVDDVDAMVAKVLEAGGKVHRPAADIPETGRFAVVADPQGSVFQLFQPLRSEPPPKPAPGTPGTGGWHELHAVEWKAAFEFYSSLFGWTKGEAIPMGPLGVYQLFELDGVAIGGMMTKAPDHPAPGWIYYFNVESIQAAAARIVEAGGKVADGPHQVPGGSWIVQGVDPQGAGFALTSMTA